MKKTKVEMTCSESLFSSRSCSFLSDFWLEHLDPFCIDSGAQKNKKQKVQLDLNASFVTSSVNDSCNDWFPKIAAW